MVALGYLKNGGIRVINLTVSASYPVQHRSCALHVLRPGWDSA